MPLAGRRPVLGSMGVPSPKSSQAWAGGEGRVGEYEKVDMSLLRTRLGHGFTGWVAQHGEPLLVPDTNTDPRGATIPGTDDVDESMLVVPMAYDGVVVGVITLSKLGLRQFDDDDQRLLLILADQAATALESARLRFRPILMTAFAFILGVVPLIRASGAGAGAQNVMGTAVFWGMLVATSLGVFLIPGNFAFVERLGRRRAAAVQPAVPEPPPGHVPTEQHA